MPPLCYGRVARGCKDWSACACSGQQSQAPTCFSHDSVGLNRFWSDSEFEEVFADGESDGPPHIPRPHSPPRGPPPPRPIQEEHEGQDLSFRLSSAVNECLLQCGVQSMMMVTFVTLGALEGGRLAIRVDRMQMHEMSHPWVLWTAGDDGVKRKLTPDLELVKPWILRRRQLLRSWRQKSR